MKKTFYISIIITIFFTNSFFSQTVEECNTVTLSSPLTGSDLNYITKEKIILNQDFEYTPSSTNSFVGQIDPYKLCELDNITQPYNSLNPYQHDSNLPVGHINGVSGVSSLGSATYEIPLDLPPGTNGIQPSISIVYNSHSGEGPLGMGWSIAGLSQIHLENNLFYADGYTESIKFDNQQFSCDRYEKKFSLNGSRLVLVEGLYNENNSKYRTENETFKEITLTNGYFKVWDKNSLVSIYGISNENKLKTDQGETISYLLEQVIDLNNNYISYEYYTDFQRRGKIKKISYTGNEQTSQLPYNEIEFFYSKRTDPQKNFIAGSDFGHYVVLESIVIKSHSAIIKKYQFNYSNNNGTRLSEVVLFGKNGEQLNSTVFEWGGIDENIFFPQNNVITNVNTTGCEYIEYDNNSFYAETCTSGYNYNGERFYIGEFNDDGIQDFVKFYSCTTFGPPGNNETEYSCNTLEIYTGNTNGTFTLQETMQFSTKTHIYIGDFNNYGVDGILIRQQQHFTEGSLWYYSCIYLSDLSKSTTTATTKDVILTPEKRYLQANFWGNGMPSYIEYYAEDITTLKIAYFEEDSYYEESTVVSNPFYGGLIIDLSDPYSRNKNYSIIDFDGDGVNELFGVKSIGGIALACIYEYNNVSNSFELLYSNANQSIFSASELINHPEYYKFTDFNGDGKSDLIKFDQANDNWKIYYSTGRTFTSTPYTYNSSFDVSSNHKLYTLDMNGDGRSDIVELKISVDNNNIVDDILKISYYVGDNIFNTTTHTLNLQSTVEENLIFGDFNGDRKLDIIYLDSYNNNYKIAFPNLNDESGRIKKITNGLLQKTEFDYAPLTSGGDFYSCNTFRDNSVYPVIEPIYVVQTMRQSSGLPNQNIEFEYNYTNLQNNVNGKGLLSFDSFSVQNNAYNTISTTQLEYDDNYFVEQTIQEEKLIGGNTTTRVETNYLIRPMSTTNTDYVAILPSSQIKTNYLDNTVTTTTNTYYNQSSGDFLGNLSSTETNFNNETSQSTFYDTYTDDGSWCESKPAQIRRSRQQGTQSPFTIKDNYTYNSNGLVSQIISDSYPTSGGKPLTKSFTYDTYGNILTETLTGNSGHSGMQSRVFTNEYSDNGRFLTKTINPISISKEYEYDIYFGNIISNKDIRNKTTTYNYDGFGKLKSIVAPMDITTSINTEWVSNIQDNMAYHITTSTSGKPTSTIWYDNLGREVLTQSDLYDKNVLKQKQYLIDGLIDKESLPYFSGNTPTQWKDYSYNTHKRVSSISSLDLTTNFGYNGLITQIEYPDGNAFQETRNCEGQLISKIHSSGNNNVTYTYSSNGNPLTITANGATTSITYDEYGNRVSLTEVNAGTLSYEYNAFGELITQSDAEGNTFHFYYDNAGRITDKVCTTNSQFSIDYLYYTTNDKLDLLQKEQMANNTFKEYNYDEFGRLTEKEENILGTSLNYQYTYDQYNNLETMIYPSGFSILNQYDTHGYLTGVYEADNTPIWQIPGTNIANEMGQILSYNQGPQNINTTCTYNNYYELTRINTGNVLDYEYVIEHATGNMLGRQDNNNVIREIFTYDDLNRLETSQIYGQPLTLKTTAYENNGNIYSKTDVGTYTYDNTKVNAVTGISTNTNTAINQCAQNITYNPISKAAAIIEGNNYFKIEYTYGADNKRKKALLYENNVLTKLKAYSGVYELEADFAASKTTEFNYISGPNGINAVHVITNGDSENGITYYLAKDHLGSIMTVFDENQNIIEEHSYDAWGILRNPQDWSYTNVNKAFIINKGYTGHEMLTDFDIINMNGRLYDPVISRVLSPDNFVQNSNNPQNYNRYSYCLNNPLKYTDPTGNMVILVRGPGGFTITSRGMVNNFGETGYEEMTMVNNIFKNIDRNIYWYGDLENLKADSDIDNLIEPIYNEMWIGKGNIRMEPFMAFKGYRLSHYRRKRLQTKNGNLISQLVIADIISADFTVGIGLIKSTAVRYSFNLNTTGKDFGLSITSTELGRIDHGKDGWGLGLEFNIGLAAHIYRGDDRDNLNLRILNGNSTEITVPEIGVATSYNSAGEQVLDTYSVDFIGNPYNWGYREAYTQTLWEGKNQFFDLFNY